MRGSLARKMFGFCRICDIGISPILMMLLFSSSSRTCDMGKYGSSGKLSSSTTKSLPSSLFSFLEVVVVSSAHKNSIFKSNSYKQKNVPLLLTTLLLLLPPPFCFFFLSGVSYAKSSSSYSWLLYPKTRLDFMQFFAFFLLLFVCAMNEKM